MADRGYRNQNSELVQVFRTFVRLGKYLFIMGSSVGVGWFLFKNYTPSQEDIRVGKTHRPPFAGVLTQEIEAVPGS
jgi:hypothetical protein